MGWHPIGILQLSSAVQDQQLLQPQTRVPAVAGSYANMAQLDSKRRADFNAFGRRRHMGQRNFEWQSEHIPAKHNTRGACGCSGWLYKNPVLRPKQLGNGLG